MHGPELAAFTRALTCLSRFKYDKEFFSRYNVSESRQEGLFDQDNGVEEVQVVKGQLLAKNLLSILRHRTVEKSVERCILSIAEGESGDAESDEEIDSLESRLIVKLMCKHGVVKTHRLVLSIPLALMAPGVPDTPEQARVHVGPAGLRNMLEHFPMQRGTKADPQLIWTFNESEVELKTCESSMDKTKGQMSTELAISAEEFDAYNLHASPIIIAFHLREFNATIAYAESMTLALDMRFTETAAPLYIDAEGDCVQGLFVIATSQPPGVPIPTAQNNFRPMPNKKRDREDIGLNAQQPKRSARIVSRVDVSSTSSNAAQSRQSSRVPDSMPPPSFPGPGTFQPISAPLPQPSQHISAKKAQEPLFLPSSQLSVTETQFLQEAGLGDIETVEDLNALLEGEGEEVDFSSSNGQKVSTAGHTESDGMQVDDTSESFELIEEMMGPSQATQKGFRPLFND